MEVSSLIPAIDEANSISEDLDKGVVFQLALIPPEYRAIGHNPLDGKMEVKNPQCINYLKMATMNIVFFLK